MLQHIESVGSFLFNIHRIHWNTAKEDWIAENLEEKNHLSVSSFSHKKVYKIDLKLLLPQRLSTLILVKEKFKHLVIPLSFFREGANEYRSFRYINSFFNFYFFVEGLYGAGNTKNYKVEESFRKSPEVVQAIEHTLAQIRNDGEKSVLLNYLKSQSCDLTIDGIIKHVVKVRGNLHHFSIHSSLKQAHPLNQQDYEQVAYLMMSICVFLMIPIYSQLAPQLVI